jgi:hypothetical protein
LIEQLHQKYKAQRISYEVKIWDYLLYLFKRVFWGIWPHSRPYSPKNTHKTHWLSSYVKGFL